MYRVYMFDGLVLPELVDQNGGNDIGTGDAMTSFTQLPGGGFVDNYGQRVSPQNVRPVTRDCILVGNTLDELYDNFNALRGKIGKRGKLSVIFDNGQIWWQWARLQRVSTPRTLEAKLKWVACGLTFITASQQWYGVIESAEAWEVGDDSFHLGDGTTELGMHDHVFDLGFPSTGLGGVLTSNGSTYVRNMRVEIALDENIDDLGLQLFPNGQRIEWENPGINGGWTLIIDTGEKSCRVRHDTEGKPIALVANYGAKILVQTTGAHGRSTGDSVEIFGTTSFDGVYHNITVTNSVVFTVDKLPERELPQVEGAFGAVYWLEDSWENLTVYDRTNWLLLAPGDNEFTISYSNNGGAIQVQDYSIRFNWADHYK